jgi:hypothetical protein
MAASDVHSVALERWGYSDDGALISALSLAYLMEQCQNLKALSLAELDLDENHCRVLETYSRPDLEIELKGCWIADDTVLAQIVGRNQGPTKFTLCDIDCSVLANGLRGHSRLKSFTPSFSWNRDVGSRELITVASSLKENKGLVNLHLVDVFTMSDEAWDAVCDSLKTHPTLEVLNLLLIQLCSSPRYRHSWIC